MPVERISSVSQKICKTEPDVPKMSDCLCRWSARQPRSSCFDKSTTRTEHAVFCKALTTPPRIVREKVSVPLRLRRRVSELDVHEIDVPSIQST